MANVRPTKPAIWTRAAKFLRETWLELRKASWPNKEELRKSTLLVLAAVLVVTIFIGGFDALLGFISRQVGLGM